METAFQIQQSRIQTLAENKDNLVYEYVYETPIRNACPEQALKLAKVAVEWRQTSGSPLTDAEARHMLVAGNVSDAPMLDFSRAYPKAFAMITEKERGPEHFAMLVRMARFAAQAEQVRMPDVEATAKINTMLQTHCALGPAAAAAPAVQQS